MQACKVYTSETSVAGNATSTTPHDTMSAGGVTPGSHAATSAPSAARSSAHVSKIGAPKMISASVPLVTL